MTPCPGCKAGGERSPRCRPGCSPLTLRALSWTVGSEEARAAGLQRLWPSQGDALLVLPASEADEEVKGKKPLNCWSWPSFRGLRRPSSRPFEVAAPAEEHPTAAAEGVAVAAPLALQPGHTGGDGRDLGRRDFRGVGRVFGWFSKVCKAFSKVFDTFLGPVRLEFTPAGLLCGRAGSSAAAAAS